MSERRFIREGILGFSWNLMVEVEGCPTSCVGHVSREADALAWVASEELQGAAHAAERLIRFYGILCANHRAHSRPKEMTLDEVGKADKVTDSLRYALALAKGGEK